MPSDPLSGSPAVLAELTATIRAAQVRAAVALGASLLATLAAGCAAPGARGPGAPADAASTASRHVARPDAWIGSWEGLVRVSGEAPRRIALTLRSDTAGGVTGALTAAAAGPAPIPLAAAAAAGDSLTLRLPASAQGLVFRGRRSAGGRRYEGVVDGAGVPITFALARTGTPEARAVAASLTRVGQSRAAGERLAAAAMADSASVRPRGDPDAARLVTADVPRFWAAVDRARAGDGAGGPDGTEDAGPPGLAARLQHDYLEAGSPGLREFIPGRILSAEDLAAAVRGQRARYDSSRAGTLRVTEAEPAVRAVFRRFKALYPDAVFPDVYFVVGRFNSGGTSQPHGLLIGAEMYRDPARLPAIIAHELIHYQQHYASPTLLGQAFREGSADFLGEMAAGAQINTEAQRYGRAHERELWREFRQRLDDTASVAPWMYGKPPGERPADLGYFIGYRIAEAYYARAADKRQAIRDIVTARGGNVRALLAQSGYNP